MPSFSSLPRALLVRSVCLSAHSGPSAARRTYLMDTSLISLVGPASRATLHPPAAAHIGFASLSTRLGLTLLPQATRLGRCFAYDVFRTRASGPKRSIPTRVLRGWTGNAGFEQLDIRPSSRGIATAHPLSRG